MLLSRVRLLLLLVALLLLVSLVLVSCALSCQLAFCLRNQFRVCLRRTIALVVASILLLLAVLAELLLLRRRLRLLAPVLRVVALSAVVLLLLLVLRSIALSAVGLAGCEGLGAGLEGCRAGGECGTAGPETTLLALLTEVQLLLGLAGQVVVLRRLLFPGILDARHFGGCDSVVAVGFAQRWNWLRVDGGVVGLW